MGGMAQHNMDKSLPWAVLGWALVAWARHSPSTAGPAIIWHGPVCMPSYASRCQKCLKAFAHEFPTSLDWKILILSDNIFSTWVLKLKKVTNTWDLADNGYIQTFLVQSSIITNVILGTCNILDRWNWVVGVEIERGPICEMCKPAPLLIETLSGPW